MMMTRCLIWLLGVLAMLSLAAADSAPPANPPRAARSVHLGYSLPKEMADAEAFYVEMAVEQSSPGSYFMAAGFNHGYFGIQELGNGKKVVLFSVWDPTRGNDAAAVPRDQRVEVLHEDADVKVKRFGGEGTGGQCFYPYDWKLKETYRFLVRAQAGEGKTAYSAYFYLPEAKAWKHLVTFRTGTGGGRLKGLYSFVEDFRRDGKSAGEVRRAAFGGVFVSGGKERWAPLTSARFTASSAEWEAKETIDAGEAAGRFYLQTGGETKTTTPLNKVIGREAGSDPPPALEKLPWSDPGR